MLSNIKINCGLEHKWKIQPQSITVSEINEEGAAKFQQDFQLALDSGQPVIPITIDSFGGSIYAANAMMDTVLSSPVPVVTYTASKAMSAGALLFLCGKTRIMAENSHLMLHASRYSEEGSCGDSSELAENSRILASLDRGLIKRVAKNCGKPTGFFKPLMTATDIYLLPKQALKLGLATNIGSAYLEVAINQTVAVRIK